MIQKHDSRSHAGETHPSLGAPTCVILQPWLPGHSIRQYDHETAQNGLPKRSTTLAADEDENKGDVVTQKIKPP